MNFKLRTLKAELKLPASSLIQTTNALIIPVVVSKTLFLK